MMIVLWIRAFLQEQPFLDTKVYQGPNLCGIENILIANGAIGVLEEVAAVTTMILNLLDHHRQI
jgi:hypothetical protein